MTVPFGQMCATDCTQGRNPARLSFHASHDETVYKLCGMPRAIVRYAPHITPSYAVVTPCTILHSPAEAPDCTRLQHRLYTRHQRTMDDTC